MSNGVKFGFWERLGQMYMAPILQILGCPEGCLEAVGNVDLFVDII